ncbi:short-chain dehydrogenase [Halalkalibacter urbisdiaboli]|uniref:short-chain dehydrogenase n=1 Tax=Halalkalibacter urbisdiaboli TaxID=1960589 RepID=UPI001FD9CCC7|nr:short-chain dehydrogenase [Halalkalibacter urbisdiaboli]
MKHALVVGGTGMLADVSIWLVNNGYKVSVIGRRKERMMQLISRGTGKLRPLVVDYNDKEKLKEELDDTVNNNGRFSLVVAWIHPEVSALNSLLHLLCCEKNWTLIHVLSSQVNMEIIQNSILLPGDCYYQQVQLGFKIENQTSRWLTHQEIVAGVIQSIYSSQKKSIVGTISPEEFRP